MAHYEYTPQGVCARKISFELSEDGIVSALHFEGGCKGNLAAISKLIEGMPAARVVDLLEGNDCGGRGTSCTDQLVKALQEVRQ